MPDQLPDGPALAGFTYWRKNPFLASAMVPLLLIVAGGRFRAIGPDGALVFDTATDEVVGSLGRMGTLKVKVQGRKYAIVGRGSLGGTEAGHSDVQRHQLAAFQAEHADGAGDRPAAAGWIDALANGSAAAKLRTWREALVAAGARVS